MVMKIFNIAEKNLQCLSIAVCYIEVRKTQPYVNDNYYNHF